MTRRNLAHRFAGCWLALVAASVARAQVQEAFCEPLCDHDMQMFAPVDFDFDCLPIRDECGYFFNYNRLSWAFTGERATIGSPGLVVDSERIFVQGPFDEGLAPPPYAVQNGIQNAPPNAEFAWGDRYELGYFRGANGWLMGIIDGPEMVSSQFFGFAQLFIPNDLPIVANQSDPDFDDGFDSTETIVGSADRATSHNGFGSVHVNFETPPGYLLGWRDYHINGPFNQQGPTVGGPGIRVVGQVINGNTGQITDITTATGADGITDNLDGDLTTFFVVFDDLNGNGQFDDGEEIGTGVDYEDLHVFNIRFDALFVHNTTQTDGIELMRTHELDNKYLPVKEQRNRFAIGYGARFFRLRDRFFWDGRGDLMGRSFSGTATDNQLVGPQIRAKWTHQRGRYGFDLDGRFLAAYNIQDISQVSGIGEDFVPGGLNSLISAQPTYSAYGRQENFFSPMAEMRVEGRYQLTSSFALKLGYTGIFVDNITRSSQVVRYRLPDMGFREDQFGKQTIFINGVDFGVEAVY